MIQTNDKLILALEQTKQGAAELERIGRAMRETFSTKNGRTSLQAIFTLLHKYREADNDEDRVLQNAAKRIQYLMGSGNEQDDIEACLIIAEKAANRKAAGRMK